jgi:hemolysin III
VSHEFAFFGAMVATWLLVRSTHSPEAARAAFVFGACLVVLFGTSALYHRVDWGAAARARMRRLDHAAIFVLIAGGYTPLFALTPSSRGGHSALAIIWLGAAAGVLKSLLWPHAPKWVTAFVCVALGWAVVGQVIDRAPVVGRLTVALLVVSGTAYSLGALVYALKRPDPYPTVFGYHEVFHAIVVVASGCLYAHVLLVVRAV